MGKHGQPTTPQPMNTQDKFKEVLENNGLLHICVKKCQAIHLEACIEICIEENKSILNMAKLHMDERAISVLNARISELTMQLKTLNQ